jgi:glycerol kinase
MKDVVLAIDQGTTGSTVLILDENITIISQANCEFPNHYPQPGWVEHNVDEIWESISTAAKKALQNAGEITIKAIGITNQRETSLFWDRESGEPIHSALVWQDRRTTDRCNQLKKDGKEELFKNKTGLVLDPYFSGTKAEWLLDNVAGAREKAERGEILFGTIDTWLSWKLCGAHVTDPSNASRTLLFNIHTMDWDDELLSELRIPRAVLPQVVDNAQIVGHTKGISFLPDGIPIAGMAGDQQSALFGQACFDVGSAKCTYGTGAFVLMNTGNKAVRSENGLLTTVGWRLGGKTTYALEGSAFIAGAAVQWLRDQLGIISTAADIETLAGSVNDSAGVSFVPALAGLGAPHWKPEARGLFCGITGGTTKAHIARAVLEGVAMQIVDILCAMTHDSGAPLQELKIDGGMARNNLMMQFQSDVLGVECIRPTVLETTALGAAFLAGLGVGLWEDETAIKEAWCKDRDFIPSFSKETIERHTNRWHSAIKRA